MKTHYELTSVEEKIRERRARTAGQTSSLIIEHLLADRVQLQYPWRLGSMV